MYNVRVVTLHCATLRLHAPFHRMNTISASLGGNRAETIWNVLSKCAGYSTVFNFGFHFPQRCTLLQFIIFSMHARHKITSCTSSTSWLAAYRVPCLSGGVYLRYCFRLSCTWFFVVLIATKNACQMISQRVRLAITFFWRTIAVGDNTVLWKEEKRTQFCKSHLVACFDDE